MRTIVIYKSKTGFTKKYAEWIAKDLAGDLYEASKATENMLESYDTIIYGGGLYASGINGVKLIQKNLNVLKEKKVIVYATGASPGRKEEMEGVVNRNFTVEEQKHIQFFYLRGGYNHRLVKSFDKILMALLKFRLKSKKQLTPDEKGMLAAYDMPVDFTRKSNIEALVHYASSTK
ncbi:flavodoxin domain-containing protein [Alkaliphilus hydrothermalis]|uniref:Menaquinone-dependent protoporphyrinogen IX oxidase n=1 Tax=Alkaliphilus hydrothermalis TaxID=1482730 RepID=A0ABS2NMQ9_9FIRM|nr:flavodoxin domain-containing protein [Alkaliphilus hydrothermalis]MBM7614117.1 menaquinone-dependent protoporphyrinogen IX oxidase [Alkaliphilus hydrothermalis]